MNHRSSIILGSGMLICMLFFGAAIAQADVGADGSQSNTDVTISAVSPSVTTIRSTTTTVSSDHTHICVVNAGADLDFDGVGGVYFFDLRLDGAAIAGTTRSVQFAQTSEDDPDFVPVSTTGFATALLGSHTFSFTGRKSVAGNENIIAQSSSLTVVCQRNVL